MTTVDVTAVRSFCIEFLNERPQSGQSVRDLESVEALELAVALEDRYAIALPDEAIGDVRTLDQLVEVVMDRIAKRSQAPGA